MFASIFSQFYKIEMDKNTENGYDPDYVAREIINSLCLEDEEVFIARYAFFN